MHLFILNGAFFKPESIWGFEPYSYTSLKDKLFSCGIADMAIETVYSLRHIMNREEVCLKKCSLWKASFIRTFYFVGAKTLGFTSFQISLAILLKYFYVHLVFLSSIHIETPSPLSRQPAVLHPLALPSGTGRSALSCKCHWKIHEPSAEVTSVVLWAPFWVTTPGMPAGIQPSLYTQLTWSSLPTSSCCC